MTTEAVLLAPVFLVFMLFLVAAGRIVEAHGEVAGAARDAVRAASVQRDQAQGQAAAEQAAQAALQDSCANGPRVEVEFQAAEGGEGLAGGLAEAAVTCTIDLSVVSFLGIEPQKEMSASAVAPLEQFRRMK
ncbi:TadE family protein [Bailinhaonella thermotolerans]|nr:TadE family protein [Bailinhaonella thermotolerans]